MIMKTRAIHVLALLGLAFFGQGGLAQGSDPLGQALDATNWIWTTGGDAPWFVQTNLTHDGLAAAQSGLIQDFGQTWLETTVVGPAALSFWWKVSSESDYDYLTFSIGGIERASISGEVDWQTQTFAVPAGQQTLAWVYSKDVDNAVGADAGWVDQVSFLDLSTLAPLIATPPASQVARLSSNVTLNVAAVGAVPMRYQWQFGATNTGSPFTDIVSATNTSISLTNLHLSDAGNFRVIVSNQFGSVTSAVATLSVPPSQLDFWAVRRSGAYPDLYAITVNEGLLVAVGYSGTILTSTDGLAWTNHPVNSTYYLNGVAYGNGLYVAVGGASNRIDISPIVTSPDGINWTPRNSGTRFPLRDVAYGHGRYVAVGGAGTILTSPEGIAWTLLAPVTALDLNGLAFGNGKFVSVADHFVQGGETNAITLLSTNGLDWSLAVLPETDVGNPKNLRGVTPGPGLFVAAGNDGTIVRSTNGQSWSGHANWLGLGNATDSNLRGADYGDGTYVVVGNTGTTLSSEDALSWKWRLPATTQNLHSVVYALGTFLAVGNQGTIVQSGPPISLNGRQRNDPRGFELTVLGESQHPYRLQSSTNLMNWMDLFTYTNFEPSLLFLDLAATNSPRLFYRVTTPP